MHTVCWLHAIFLIILASTLCQTFKSLMAHIPKIIWYQLLNIVHHIQCMSKCGWWCCCWWWRKKKKTKGNFMSHNRQWEVCAANTSHHSFICPFNKQCGAAANTDYEGLENHERFFIIQKRLICLKTYAKEESTLSNRRSHFTPYLVYSCITGFRTIC